MYDNSFGREKQNPICATSVVRVPGNLKLFTPCLKKAILAGYYMFCDNP